MRPMDGRGAKKERGEEHGHGKGMPAGQAARSAIRKSGSGDLGRRKAGLADERRACATQPQHLSGNEWGRIPLSPHLLLNFGDVTRTHPCR
jgi:hypothetical protein